MDAIQQMRELLNRLPEETLQEDGGGAFLDVIFLQGIKRVVQSLEEPDAWPDWQITSVVFAFSALLGVVEDRINDLLERENKS